MMEDVELGEGVKEAAKTEIRRREWASKRGKATRDFLRAHPEVQIEFEETHTISATSFPSGATRASVLLELRQRAARKETTRSARLWIEEHPKEAKKLRKDIRDER